jgi:hypothetical protein
MSTSDHTPSDLESVRERLNVVTQETRFSLLQDILGHPSELPTLKELDYVNPSKSQTTIRQHLQQLVDAGIVEEVLYPRTAVRTTCRTSSTALVGVVDSSLRSISSTGHKTRFERSTTAWRRPTTSNDTRLLRDPSANSPPFTSQTGCHPEQLAISIGALA